ncbi:MAG: UDP-2,3-diacylglucosamine diphosphatase [Paludibacteraceae bacterium]|nr:UDP-2,3-diacylglucosamine diphosphatase [Paludibacteraceae bacterium]
MITEKRKRYFVSDAHLGSQAFNFCDRERELKLVRFLDFAKADASDIYFLGDIFDFWYEYNHYAPKGFTRLLGKMSELADSGIRLHFFKGNHDLWTFGYLEKEIGLKVYGDYDIQEFDGKKFFISHGDMVGYRPLSVRIMQAFFHNRFIQWLYSTIHPSISMKFGLWWSKSNRLGKHTQESAQYFGEDKEYLVQFAKETLKKDPTIDFFIFGHRHVLLDLMLKDKKRVVYLGDWIDKYSYGVWDGENFTLEFFEAEE